MHRTTSLSNAKARFSTSINGDACLDFKGGMLTEQLTVLLAYFNIKFVKVTMEGKKKVAILSATCLILDTAKGIQQFGRIISSIKDMKLSHPDTYPANKSRVFQAHSF